MDGILHDHTMEHWLKQCLEGDNCSLPFLLREVNERGADGFTSLLKQVHRGKLKLAAWKFKLELPHLAEKYLTKDNADLFTRLIGHIDLNEETTSIVLANKWDISSPYLFSIFSDSIDGKVEEDEVVRFPYTGSETELYRAHDLGQCDGMVHLARSAEHYFQLFSFRKIDIDTYCTRANLEARLSNKYLKKGVLQHKIKTISTVFGLRYILTDSLKEKNELVSILIESMKNEDPPISIASNVKEGLLRSARLMGINKYMEPDANPTKELTVPDTALSQFGTLDNILAQTPMEGLFSEAIGYDEGGRRRILKEMFYDPSSEKEVSTIIKLSDDKKAKGEQKNFSSLSKIGLPVPQVYEIVQEESYSGIRVEDLTKGEEYILIMDSGRGEIEDLFNCTSNERELVNQLSSYETKLKGILDLRKPQNRRVLGLIWDKQSYKGSLYFVDVDHIKINN